MQIFIFIIGLVLGSFYNVVGLRLPNNESVIKPGSHCPKCNHKLKWYENIPIFSYIFLRGKCSSCHEKISVMYPIIELLTGILFLLSYYIFGLTENFYIAVILSSLVVLIYITDSKFMIILDSPLVISTILIFIIRLIFEGIKPALLSLAYGLLIFTIVYLIMLLGNFLFKRESLGGGDIKLSFIAGISLGPILGLFYIVLGAFLAFPYAVYISIKNSDGMLPFGPFLATSMLLLYLNYDIALEFIKKLFYIL